MFLAQKNIKMCIFSALLFTGTKALSQNNKVGTWNLVNAEYYIKSKFFIWGEVQTRSQKMYQDFYYHELKGGMGYKPTKDITLLLGTGQYGTYSEGGNFKSPVLSHEFRIWEQLVLNNHIGRGKIEHRYRIEQRWRNGEYRNRFRYRFNPVIAINKSTIEKGTLFLSVYDEVFLTDVGPHFERNRVFAGLGYQVGKPVMVQVGWLNQFDYSAESKSTNKNYVQLGVYLQLNKE
jgi:hypothetical protein